MKFKIQQALLIKALTVVNKNVALKPQLPILGGILLEVSDQQLILKTTDLYVGVQTKLPIKMLRAGKLVVPANKFRSLIAAAPKEELTIKVINNNCLVTSANSRAELLSLPSAEFPDFPKVEEKPFLISTSDIKRISRLVASSASTDQNRPILNAVLFNFLGSNLEVVATDGVRMSVLKLETRSEKETQFLIPARALNDISQIASEASDEVISISVDEVQKQAVVNVAEYSFYLRLIDGQYPPYQEILPTETPLTARFDLVELRDNLQRAILFGQNNTSIVQFFLQSTNPDLKKGVAKSSSSGGEEAFEPLPPGVQIKAVAPGLGEFSAVLTQTELVGEGGEIAFDTRYLSQLLQNLIFDEAHPQIEFGMSDSNKPTWFKVENEPGFLYVAMPFKINQASV